MASEDPYNSRDILIADDEVFNTLTLESIIHEVLAQSNKKPTTKIDKAFNGMQALDLTVESQQRLNALNYRPNTKSRIDILKNKLSQGG